MQKFMLAAIFATMTFGGFAPFAHADTVPCEDMLKTLAETMKTAKLSDADMKSVTDLKVKAEERCTAEDDKRSDGFVTDAMKIMGK